MSEYRPYKHVLEIAAAQDRVRASLKKPKPALGPLPDPQTEADAVAWVKNGCKGPCWSMIRPPGKPNLRPL